MLILRPAFAWKAGWFCQRASAHGSNGFESVLKQEVLCS